MNFGSTTTTTHVSADRPPHLPIPASARDQPGAGNETGPEPQQEIAPANGQILESTAHARTAGAASAQRTEEVSQRTLSHLPITSIDSHAPPHSALNSSFALPLVQSVLNSSFALPPAHSALLPVNDIPLKQPPAHHSVKLAHAFTGLSHSPRTQNKAVAKGPILRPWPDQFWQKRKKKVLKRE